MEDPHPIALRVAVHRAGGSDLAPSPLMTGPLSYKSRAVTLYKTIRTHSYKDHAHALFKDHARPLFIRKSRGGIRPVESSVAPSAPQPDSPRPTLLITQRISRWTGSRDAGTI
jgi:hypothetical protein